jgi:Tfp pilus assembly ATPase PilU
MHTFDQTLVAMAKDGRITHDEALAHAVNPDMLRMGFQGVVVSEASRILRSRE